MRIDFSNARRLLKQLDLRALFTQEMNWNSPDMGPFPLTVPAGKFLLTPVAEKGGVLVLTAECKTTDDLPDKSARLALHTKLTEQAFEHIIVFVNMAHTSTVWLRVEREGGRRKGVHEDRFHVSETGERLLQKLEGIAFDWSELDEDGQATIFQVTDKISASLATDKVTKRF